MLGGNLNGVSGALLQWCVDLVRSRRARSSFLGASHGRALSVQRLVYFAKMLYIMTNFITTTT